MTDTCSYLGAMFGAAGSGGGIVEPTVANYASLPGSPSDGDRRRVLDDVQADSYTFVETISGEDFGFWVPTRYAQRFDRYMEDASNNPCKISTGVGTDNRAAILARGWADVGSTATTDAAGTIELASSGSGEARLEFIPGASELNTTDLFALIEADIIAENAGGGSAAWIATMLNNFSDTQIGLCWLTTGNELSFGGYDGDLTGVGALTRMAGTAAFETLFWHFSQEADNRNQRRYLWSGEQGFNVLPDDAMMISARQVGSTHGLSVRLRAETAAANGNTIRIRELHVIRLAA